MQTPKTLRQLGEILSQETLGSIPSLEDYMQKALKGEPCILSPWLRISGNGRLEASQPNGPKAFANRLIVRALVRVITQAALAGIPVGSATTHWMGCVLRAGDMQEEAKTILRRKNQPQA